MSGTTAAGGAGVRSMEGRVVWITGAASGIGAACALRFARAGARIAGFDLAEPDAESDWGRAAELAPEAGFHTGDVTDETRLGEVVAELRGRFGRIDVLVNSAGVAGGGAVHMVETEAWDRVLDINLKGTFLACRAVLPGMLEQGGGNIVNLASVEGLEGFAGGSSYNASKGGVVLLTRNMAIDYGRRNIRVNAVCPGFIETPMLRGVFALDVAKPIEEEVRQAHQLGRFGRPEEIANAVHFLASDEASFVTGVALPVDGGYTCGHRFSTAKLMGLE